MMLSLKDIAHDASAQKVVRPADRFIDALDLEELQTHGCIYVTDENRTLVGIVTDGDIRRTLHKRAVVDALSIADVMTTGVHKIVDNASLVDAYRKMADQEINHLPIVDARDTLIGFISFHELLDKLSPEHLYIDLAAGLEPTSNEKRHISRYTFAASFIRAHTQVLDCACGVGYGSSILAKKGAYVTGVDASDEAISFARAHYSNALTNYEVTNIANLDFPPASFDAVVSLETLEHIPNDLCKDFLARIVGWLRPGGILVSSSPMLRFKDGEPYVTNPYHINELPKSELIQMFEDQLPGFAIHLYHQDEDQFLPLLDENTGFCVLIARKA